MTLINIASVSFGFHEQRKFDPCQCISFTSAIGVPAPDSIIAIIPYFGCRLCLSGRGRLIDPRYSELVEALGQKIAQQGLAEQVTHGLVTRIAGSILVAPFSRLAT